MFIIPRWIMEEETFVHAVTELIYTGTTVQLGYKPILESYLLYFVYLLTHIDVTILCQYANPFFGAITVIPIYYIIKNISTQRIAIITTTLWAFNENMIYRSSTFNSTETLGFFFALIALYMYIEFNISDKINIKARYVVGFIIFILLSVFTHTLPPIFIIGVVSLDLLLKGSRKIKIGIFIFILSLFIFLISPLNPNQVLAHTIFPASLLSQFNIFNLFLYNIPDMILGLSIFLGSIIILTLSFISILIYKPNVKIMYIYLFGAISLFFVSLFFYSPFLIGPTRSIFYFVLPISYFISVLISKLNNKYTIFITLLLIITMITTSMFNVNTMLYLNNTVTTDEYNFLSTSTLIHDTSNYQDWWMDTPLKSSILLFYSPYKIPILPETMYNMNNARDTIQLNSTRVTVLSNGTIIPPKYKYILLSQRMEKSAFFTVNTKYRTLQIIIPIVDVWKDLPDWKLVESHDNVKIYKWIGI
jgi:hypothetical protein